MSTATTSTTALDLPTENLLWASITLSEVTKNDNRILTKNHHIEGKHARETVENCGYDVKHICGDNGISEATYPNRFKRIYVDNVHGIPFLLPSQINQIYPKPNKYISPITKCDLDELKAEHQEVLLTRSGTVGTCAFVSDSLADTVLSDDIIRIHTLKPEDSGYIYAYLSSKIGSAILKTNQYGAVISHIEPEHLENITIPYPAPKIRKEITDFILKSHNFRDSSNNLIDEALQILIDELNLPPIEHLRPDNFSETEGLRNFSTPISKLNHRFDASYHLPIYELIVETAKKRAADIKYLGDNEISEEIILPGRFKRNYVQEGQGTVFFGGKQIYELDPSNKKYLSLITHSKKIAGELSLKHNSTLITASGTIGRVNIVPKHWEKWTMNQHVMRIVPSSAELAGYIFIWLNSDYGRELICKNTYGAVVDELDVAQAAQIPIPLLKDKSKQDTINDLALSANNKRYEAYLAEQQAMKILNEEVLGQKPVASS